MSSIRPSCFNFKDFTVADLNEADIILKDKKRTQGLRYTLIKQTPNGQETKTIVFHDLYKHLEMLTKKLLMMKKNLKEKQTII